MDLENKVATEILRTNELKSTRLFFIGTFDSGITVYSQQVRSLNLVWALAESNILPFPEPERVAEDQRSLKVAIVGAGFAGLTVAAGLLKKKAAVEITLLEERDALLPLQQGSDSRWLHPRIYDWPSENSDSNVAMLPVLNWAAARASDVVVQVLQGWKRIVDKHANPKNIALYCNTRHIHIHKSEPNPDFFTIEWVGERRNSEDGSVDSSRYSAASGMRKRFDVVILAIGFGLEKEGAISYWRNEILGQPSLEQPRRTFLVSGQGDGAMIDLFRLCISQYRQDRILEQLFGNKGALLKSIRVLYKKFGGNSNRNGMFQELDNWAHDTDTKEQIDEVETILRNRLRRDTDVIYHMKEKRLSDLFDSNGVGISFQNRLLFFLLYRCGGFFPSSLDEKVLMKGHSVESRNIIRRHGTLRDQQFERILSNDLFSEFDFSNPDIRKNYAQSAVVKWPGGYFDHPGRERDASSLHDNEKVSSYKEYLPGATEIVCSSLCGIISAYLLPRDIKTGRFRVTLHRVLSIGDKEVLQQTCDYQGTKNAREANKSAAARVLPTENATIGLAFKHRKIIRSIKSAETEKLQKTMEKLNLSAKSRKMSKDVKFILAIPILQSDKSGKFFGKTPVSGILYIDSTIDRYFIDDDTLTSLVTMIEAAVHAMERYEVFELGGVRNVPLSPLSTVEPSVQAFDPSDNEGLDSVDSIGPPRTSRAFQFNFDYSDFVPV